MVYPTGLFGVWVIYGFHSFSAADSPRKLFLIEDFHSGVKQWMDATAILVLFSKQKIDRRAGPHI
jgi:hypothetical protein